MSAKPAPVPARLLGGPRLGGWQELAGDRAAVDRLRARSPWAAGHLAELAALEEHSALLRDGGTLLHGDLYPFNVLLAADRVHVVDWPHA